MMFILRKYDIYLRKQAEFSTNHNYYLVKCHHFVPGNRNLLIDWLRDALTTNKLIEDLSSLFKSATFTTDIKTSIVLFQTCLIF